MEHFPPVLELHEPIEIPFLGGDWVAGDDVTCADLDLSLLSKRSVTGETTGNEGLQLTERRKRAAAQVQARLFFGMLHGVLQLDVEKSDFLDKNDTVLTTRQFRKYLRTWKSFHDALRNGSSDPGDDSVGSDRGAQVVSSIKQLDARREKAEKTLNDAYDVWCAVDWAGLASQDAVDGERLLKVHLSIQLLGAALEHAVESVTGNCNQCDFAMWVETENVPSRRDRQNAYLTDRMKGQGWCPTVIESLRRSCGLPFMYFVSTLGAPNRRGHAAAQCNPGEACKLTNINKIDYKPKHVEDSCECEFLGPTEAGMQTIRETIDEGGVPLLYIDGDGQMAVKQHEWGMDYTAISHVWADGLGNDKSNSLPACQIKQLLELMSKLPWTELHNEDVTHARNDVVWKSKPDLKRLIKDKERRLYFWIDPICVPLEPEETKLKAIANMRAVYSRANRVLVLDADLQKTRVRVAGPAMDIRSDIKAKIIASTWPRRYWTLQESALAKVVWFQFENDVFRLVNWSEYVVEKVLGEAADELEQAGEAKDRLVKELLSPGNLRKVGLWGSIEYFYDDEIGWECEQVRYQFNYTSNDLERFRHVWLGLGSRGCSKPEDRPLCMAILMDMPLENMLKTKSEPKRIVEFWERLTVIPVGLLAFPCEKHGEANLRWAPLRIDQLSMVPAPLSQPAYVESNGAKLKFQMHGFSGIRSPSLDQPQGVIPVNLKGNVYYIRNNIRNGNQRWVEEDTEGQVTKINIDFAAVQEIGVVLAQTPLEEGQSIPAFKGALGILVSVKRRDGQVLVVRYLGSVSIIGKDSFFDRHPSWAWSDREMEEKRLENVVMVKEVLSTQEWLIEGDQN